MQPSASNRLGFFEDLDAVELNDRWLGSLGGSWWAPPKVGRSGWESLPGDLVAADRDARARPGQLRRSDGSLLESKRLLTMRRGDRLIVTRQDQRASGSVEVEEPLTGPQVELRICHSDALIDKEHICP